MRGPQETAGRVHSRHGVRGQLSPLWLFAPPRHVSCRTSQVARHECCRMDAVIIDMCEFGFPGTCDLEFSSWNVPGGLFRSMVVVCERCPGLLGTVCRVV